MSAPRLLTTRRMARRSVVGSGSGYSATLVRVRRAALPAPEHALAAVTSATVLRVSLLGLRFPRLLARPPGPIGALFAWLRLVGAALSMHSDREPFREPENTESGV
jgi:hypothetical protein